MTNLSISVDSWYFKKSFVRDHNMAYISATFSNDLKTREFVEKLLVCFKSQTVAIFIEDPTVNEYKNFFHNTHLIELENTIVAFDVNCDDAIRAISNWCYYEISASIYVLINDINQQILPSKKKTLDFLKKNSSVIIEQELDYTVNIYCTKEAFDYVLKILKNECFNI